MIKASNTASGQDKNSLIKSVHMLPLMLNSCLLSGAKDILTG